ncbi:SRPBCC family protein [Mucilaginibacter ginsenosidivorans]|uniref:SRPBCC domain-containing protein n=1 Tax=Mucilaginibacter ginsenosidivorans TaxID=398053 RepID=A0A5B8V3F8_9SPHI|nr:SRPBCC domain-containing protein [Mucilaginibacter ginsenosidivorans]QEC65231.1 SRPBCC domain-containing protein [Mucilaginibacter ginsenosidivorans]
MNEHDFTTSFLVDQSPKDAFEAIANVRGWWTEGVDGNTEKLNDEFSVQFWDVHYSRQKLVEVVPYTRIVWQITDSKLTFIADESEWTGTKIIFDIAEKGDQTEVRFTQIGLVPEIECYKDCSNAWGGYINGSLKSLIATGKGKPTTKEELNR